MAINNRSRTPLLAVILCLALTPSAGAQQQKVMVYDASKYILVDARLLRCAIGYSTFSINDVDTLQDRLAQGLNMRTEARIVSGLVKRTEGLVIADALFLDLTMGLMRSAPIFYYDNPEPRFSYAMQFGYSFLAGYSNEHIGALGGKSFNWSGATVGGTDLPGAKLLTATGPWMARFEFRPAFSNEFRIMLTAWDNFNPDQIDQGLRVDIPFLPENRFFLTYQYGHRSGDVSAASFDNYRYAPVTFTQHLFGLRVGSIY